ncbi:hypothetical protein C8R43DRAFT_1114609 [Mycena crocata]|nr:hypothetical protein C8R43DRAFT_1114609 [Mycena crocata]
MCRKNPSQHATACFICFSVVELFGHSSSQTLPGPQWMWCGRGALGKESTLGLAEGLLDVLRHSVLARRAPGWLPSASCVGWASRKERHRKRCCGVSGRACMGVIPQAHLAFPPGVSNQEEGNKRTPAR